MKSKEFFERMDLIDDDILEKNLNKKYRVARKPIMISLIAAALAVAMLTAIIVPAIRADDWKPPVFTDETDAQTEPVYEPSNGAAFQLLTAQTYSPNREKGEISNEFRDVTANFAFELLKNSQDHYEGEGLLVSPLSAMLALAMAANGAEGETLAEMENALACGMYIGRLNQELFDYTSSLISTDDAKFNLANAIYLTSSPKFSVNKNFLKTVENTFDADVISVDMGNPATIDAINNWVNEETFGMIDDIASPNNVNPSTVMMILNALAFDALWESQVDDSACRPGTFNGKEGATFMKTYCNAYIEGKNEVGIVKNYMGGKYAFVALLPNEGISIKRYMSSLQGCDFLELFDSRINSGSNVKVSANMPHFTFDCTIDLIPVLREMGIKTAFEPSKADLSALGTLDGRNLFIGSVAQKTYIDLNNSGTRAAAVTIGVVGLVGWSGNKKEYFVNLDRPFVYAIVDTQTGLPLFLGACENIE